MPKVKIPDGFTLEDLKAVAAETGQTQTEAAKDMSEAIESGCTDLESILAYLRPGENPATLHEGKESQPPKAGFNLAGYIGQLSDLASASLVTAGRYDCRVSDVKIGAEPNDLGLRYGVFDLEIIDHPDADPVPLFAAVDVDDTLIDGDGLPRADMDPVARARFLGGLKVLEKLIRFTDVTPEEIADAENVDDVLALFIGCTLKVAITKGTDRDGLPCNKVKTIIGASSGD